MPNIILKFILSLLTILTITSCSSENESEIRTALGTDIVVVDGYIRDANVTDSNSNKAKYKSNGTYTFTPAPTGEITVSGGFFEDTGLPNTMTYKVSSSSRVISPITSFLYKYPHLKQKILTALGIDSIELLGDFVKSNSVDVAKLAQLMYVMNINNLEDDFANTLTNDTDPVDIDDIFTKAKARVTANNPTKATQMQNFLDVVKAYVGSVSNFEVAIQTEKENTYEDEVKDGDSTEEENEKEESSDDKVKDDGSTEEENEEEKSSDDKVKDDNSTEEENQEEESSDDESQENNNDNSNIAPVLNNISNITVTENDTIIITPTAMDDDNDTLTYTYTGWMSSNRYITTITDAGSYTVTVTVSDGNGGSDSQDITITVNDFVSVLAGEAKLNFSDIISGPATGLNDSLGSGAIVTVWGNNLGSSQGTSKIYFKDSLGVAREAAHVYYWKNADGNLPSGPANLYESHKMQEIAFSIPVGSADGQGTIYIESNSIVSNTLPFRIRAGNILWVSPAGVNGAACSFDEPCGWINGDLATYNSSALGNGHLDAGDIVYSRGVEEPDTCGGGACAGMFLRSVVGTADNPISIISYPGTQAKVKSKIRGIQGYYSDHINISKYHISVGDKDPSTAINAGNPAASNFHISTMKGRYVGNYLDEVTGKCFNGWSGSITSSGNGGSDAKIFGNHFFDLGCDNTSRYQHTLYMSVRSETANAKAWEIGWNYLQDNKSISGIHNYDETYSGDCGTLRGVMSIHDNYIINQKGNGIDVKTRDLHGERNDCWAVDIDIFNNVLINVGLGPKGEDDVTIAQAIILSGDINISNVNIYNNTIFGYSDALSRVNSTPSAISIGFSRANPIIKIENNYIHATGDYTFINTSEPNVIENNNLYYSDATQSTQDPQCSLNGFDLECLSTSPLIDAGLNKTPYDIYGTARGTNSDIGAYEYNVNSQDDSNSYCGDNTLNTNTQEECDDGNNIDGDGCSSNCLLEEDGDSNIVPMSKSNFKYLGAFRVPKGSFNGSSFGNNPHVNAQYQPLTYNPYNNSLFLGKMSWTATSAKKIGEITIPEIISPLDVDYDITRLNEATVIQAPLDISDGEFDKLRLNGNTPSDEAKGQLGGLFVYEEKLFGTVWAYYDASGSLGYRSHWSADLDWSSGINFSGLHAVGESPTGSFANGGFVGGYMAEIPDEYKGVFGYELVTGRVGGPIVGRSSYGPTLWGFNHNQLNFDIPAQAEMFVGYPSDHQTLGGYNDIPSLMYNRATGVKGVIWPKESSSIFFFGGLGLGVAHDATGIPLNNTNPSCTGAGTSNRNEVKSNSWLQENSPEKWTCGYIELDASDITNGASCCFDPINPSYGSHFNPFVIGAGESCYGVGTSDHTIARKNTWLLTNSPNGYVCQNHTIAKNDISAGSACCFVGTQSTDKGGAAYPGVYQVWQYEVEDLISVKNGVKEPWELIPTVWNFDLPFDNPLKGKQILGVTYDPSSDRVYMGQAFGDGNHPLIHVFKIISD